MVLFATLFAFSYLLGVQADTFVKAKFELECKDPNPFIYTATITELDNFPWSHDLIAKNGGDGTGRIQAYLAGEDTGDGSPTYEFELKIEHNCGGLGWKSKYISLNGCSTSATRCEYPANGMYPIVL